MSNSLNFCRIRASDPDVSIYSDRDWNLAYEFGRTDEIFFELMDGMKYEFVPIGNIQWNKYFVSGRENGDEFGITVNLIYAPNNIDFDFFISESFLSDGTFSFKLDAIRKLANGIIFAERYNKEVGKPENGDELTYTFGNFVVLNELDDYKFRTKERPWLKERTTILLPVKYAKKHN